MSITKTFSIIIPALNERENLEKLLPVLVLKYPKSPILIIDDNSKDQTDVFLAAFSKKHPQVRLITRNKKWGRGNAVMTGLKIAFQNYESEYLLEMDADFSHNPDDIDKLLKHAASNTVIIGSRHLKGGGFVSCSRLRVWLSILANFYARLFLSIPITDYTNGFRLYSRKAVETIIKHKIHEKGYIVLSETAYILHKNGFQFTEVPTVFSNRTIGKSNATIYEFMTSLIGIIKIYLRGNGFL